MGKGWRLPQYGPADITRHRAACMGLHRWGDISDGLDAIGITQSRPHRQPEAAGCAQASMQATGWPVGACPWLRTPPLCTAFGRLVWTLCCTCWAVCPAFCCACRSFNCSLSGPAGWCSGCSRCDVIRDFWVRGAMPRRMETWSWSAAQGWWPCCWPWCGGRILAQVAPLAAALPACRGGLRRGRAVCRGQGPAQALFGVYSLRSRSSAARRVSSCLAKQKRTTFWSKPSP